ncbi:hypothetical protein Tco_1511913, partial [Tanacetum coccineum]
DPSSKHQNSRIALARRHDQNGGPKRDWDNRVLYENENIPYGNKRIRRSESDCDSRSNSTSKPVLYETTNISLDMARS